MINKKNILIIDSILVLGILISAFLLIGYSQPLAIGPLYEEPKNSLIFSIQTTDYIILDSNLNFDSPHTIFIDDKLTLEPGTYYIKTFSELSSEIREIKSEIVLELQIRRINDGLIGLFNIGSSPVQVETYNVGSLINYSLINNEGKK